MKKNNTYIALGLLALLCIIIFYMVFSNRNIDTFQNIEGFSSNSNNKSNSKKLGNRSKENFLANEIKTFLHENPSKENMTDSPLRKLRNNKGASNNKKGNNKGKNNNKLNKLKSLSKKGKVDEFKNVRDEVDSLDLSSISVTGISDTIRRYNDNFESRLKYAKEKNNSSAFESAMAQFGVIKDEFVKIFAFSDYI
jgi:hypothetical protein